VVLLVNESIEKIKKAEDDAKDLLKRSQAESDGIIKEAREQSAKRMEDAKKQASDESKIINRNAESEAEKEITLLREKNQAVIDNLKSVAETNKSKAASLIIERIIVR
jgi:V/A-type H+-transporting ATPase subunit G/H